MTVSARNFVTRELVSLFVGVLFISALVFAYWFVGHRNDQDLSVKGMVFKTEVVSDKDSMARGLSGRDSIDRDAAMVFEFSQTGQHCMWMKDMKFAIDIAWLDQSHKITAIEQNVTPDSYPKTFCHDGSTVVEFAAGTTDRLPLYIGDTFRY